MNSSLPKKLHCLNPTVNVLGDKGMEVSVLERQKMVLKWQQQLLQVQQHSLQQQQQELSCFNDLSMLSFLPAQDQDFRGLDMKCGTSPFTRSPTLNEIMNRPIKVDPGMENGWMDFGMQNSGVTVESLGIESIRQVISPGYGVNYAISKTASCPPTMAIAAAAAIKIAHDTKGMESTIAEQKPSRATGKESCKKRKAEKSPIQLKVSEAQEDRGSKKSKGCMEEEESKVTEDTSNRSSRSSQSKQKESISNNDKKNKETSGCTYTDKSKASELQKPDYIHVRARRGQATDSHSLAERVRREKISERMRYLQDLVPGCNKITGKAGMLDEIINYVQSLQRQVEFLSMKLATVNPRLDFNIEDLIAKEVFAAFSASSPTMGLSPDLTTPSYMECNSIQQMDPICGSEFMTNSVDIGLRRSISAPVSDTLVDSTCFNLTPSSLQWDADLQNIYNMEFQQGRPASFSRLT